jgi:hypothetical protein
MENLNNKHNSEQKKSRVTPELFNESVNETEGKNFSPLESNMTSTFGGPGIS